MLRWCSLGTKSAWILCSYNGRQDLSWALWNMRHLDHMLQGPDVSQYLSNIWPLDTRKHRRRPWQGNNKGKGGSESGGVARPQGQDQLVHVDARAREIHDNSGGEKTCRLDFLTIIRASLEHHLLLWPCDVYRVKRALHICKTALYIHPRGRSVEYRNMFGCLE